MKKITTVLVSFSLLFALPTAHADLPPQADVTCSLSDIGVSYSISMVFSGGSISFNSLSYKWDYMVAPTGTNPQLLSSYGARTTFTGTTSNGLNLTYEDLLGYAKNDVGAAVLLYANSVFTSGDSVLTNTGGRGCYVELPAVLKNKEALVAKKAEAEKLAAAQKAEAEKLAAQAALEKEAGLQTIAKLDLDLQAKVAAVMAKYPTPTIKANVTKYMLSKPRLADSATATPQQVAETAKALAAFTLNLDKFVASMLLNTAVTITCVKGKVSKSVTAVRAKCPSGYKQK